MSLFLPQQKIPFQSVIRSLRAFAPSCETPPADWARQHAADMAPGDLVVIFDTILSPWGDSSAGIGVAEDDSFKAAQLILICQDDVHGSALVVSADGFRKQALDTFLASEAAAAKDNGSGFYYAIVRPNKSVNSAGAGSFVQHIPDFGDRLENGTDVAYGFFHAAGILADSENPGGTLDITAFGYLLFLDKEPPAGSRQPDLRAVMIPVSADEHRASSSEASSAAAPSGEPSEPSPSVDLNLGSSEPAAAPAISAPPPLPVSGGGGGLPKMPSFFSKPKISSPQGPQPAQAGSGGPPPLPAGAPAAGAPAAAAPSVVPPPVIRKPEGPRRMSSPQGGDAPTPTISAPPPLPQSKGAIADFAAGLADLGKQLESAAANPPADVVTMEHDTSAVIADTALESPPEAAAPGPSGGFNPEELYFSQPPESPKRVRPGRGEAAAQAQPAPPSAPESPAAADTPPAAASAPPVDDSPAKKASRPMIGGGAFDWSLDDSSGDDSNGDSVEAPTSQIDEPSEQAPNSSPPAPDVATFSRLAPPAPVAAITPHASPEITPPSAVAPESVPVVETKLDESPADTAADAIMTPTIAPLPPRKKKQENKEEAPPRPQVKEPPAVKSGVAGLVSKLEQQASKASIKLESQVDDIQNRLSDELRRLLNKVEGAEKRSVKSAEGLRINLTHRMEHATNDVKLKVSNAGAEGADTVRERKESGCSALDEKAEYLRTSLGESFDEVRARAEAVAKTFEDNIAVKSSESVAELETLRDSIKTQLQELQDSYTRSLQASYDHLKKRLERVNTAAVAATETRYEYLHNELADLQHRCQEQMEQTKDALLKRLSREITVAQAELSKLQSGALEESILPRLKQHREELRVITGEFQHKLGEDLHRKGESKVAEFGPMLADKKRKLVDMLEETNKVKAAIQEQLKGGLENIFADLKEFVSRSIDDAQNVHKQTEEQLTEIDRAVRALADPSSIEGDMELLNERNDVLEKLEEVTEEAKDEVLGTLRRLLAGLEEKSKHLQEEMITSMEEDAYVVRRASEQALISVREAINESFVAIQTAQDERMPM